MALGTIIDVANSEAGRSGGPVILTNITVVGDGAYPAGGTPGFQALVRASLGYDIEILAVVQQDISDFVCRYDKVNDKLIVVVMSTGAEAAGSLAGTTFQLLVVGK